MPTASKDRLAQRPVRRTRQGSAANYGNMVAADIAGVANSAIASAQVGTAANRAGDQYLAFRNRVYTSVRPIMQLIAGQPILMARKPKNRKAKRSLRPSKQAVLPRFVKQLVENLEVIEDHDLLRALHNPKMCLCRGLLMQSTVASLECTAKYFWWVFPDEDGEKCIWPLPTTWVTPMHEDGYYTSYKIRVPGQIKSYTIPGDEVVPFIYPDPADPFRASRHFRPQAAAVTGDEAILTSQISGFRNGIHPGMAIITGDVKDPGNGNMRPRLEREQRLQLINVVKAYHRGVIKHGEPMIFDALVRDVKNITTAPKEMDWKDSAEVMHGRISQGFGTNPIITGEIEGANRASAVAAELHFTRFTVNPKIDLISQLLTARFMPMFAADNEELVVWIEPCMPDDPETKRLDADLLAKYGALLVDEMRSMYGLPELPNKAGQVHMAAMSLTFIPADETGVIEQSDPDGAEPDDDQDQNSNDNAASEADEQDPDDEESEGSNPKKRRLIRRQASLSAPRMSRKQFETMWLEAAHGRNPASG